MLIFIAHGSRNPAWRGSLEALIESIAAESGGEQVRLAYMECTPPTLADVASEAARAGASRIRIVPLFLCNEGHVDRDIRPLVAEIRAALRPVEVELLPALGQHPRFRDLLRDIAAQALE